MADAIQRMNYFKNQFLHVEDFNAEQGYHLGMRRRHNRWLHSMGVAQGLELSYAPNGTAVTVGEGMAIDNQGREIVLVEDATLELADFEGGREVWVTIAYTEVPTKEQNETGVKGNTRVEERPELVGLLSKPAEGTRIILGRVERGGDNGTRITKVDSTVRTTAGAIEGDVLLTPRDPAVPADDYVTLKWSGAKQADVTGSLRVRRFSPTTADGNLTAEGGLALDQANRNAGDLGGGASSLVFGTASGEGILSKRTAGANQFGLDLVTRAVPRLSISNAGNVGIGTGGAPAQVPLEVRGEARVRTLAFGAPDGSVLPDAWLGLATNVEGATRWLHLGGITDAGARRLAFFGDRLYVSGRVGLGVTAPTNRLHVADNTGIRQNRLFLSGGGGSGWSSLSFNAHHDAANSAWVFVEPASTAVTLEMDASPGFPRFDVFATTAANPTSWVPRFRIDGETGTTILVPVSGNVGIGTNAPQAKLEVAGDIRWGRSALNAEQGGSIELGGLPTTAGGGTPYIDFHFSGLTQDFNMRLINDADRRLSLFGGNLYVAGGAVGIGTLPAPGVSLDVAAGNTTAAFRRGWGNWIELWKTDVNPRTAWFIHTPQAPNSALTVGFFDGTNTQWGRLTLAPDGVLTVPSIACEQKQAPAFAPGWGDYGGGWSPVRFYKDPFGIVHLEGLASKHGGTGTPISGETILTLPVGYRPASALLFAIHAGEPNGVARVDVYTDGRVVFVTGPVANTDYQSLSTVHFRAA